MRRTVLSWCSLMGCIFAGVRHPIAGPFPCGAMGCLCVFRAVTVGELNMSPCLQDGWSLTAGLSCLRAVPVRWMSKAGCAVLSVVGEDSGPLTAPPATSV